MLQNNQEQNNQKNLQYRLSFKNKSYFPVFKLGVYLA